MALLVGSSGESGTKRTSSRLSRGSGSAPSPLDSVSWASLYSEELELESTTNTWREEMELEPTARENCYKDILCIADGNHGYQRCSAVPQALA